MKKAIWIFCCLILGITSFGQSNFQQQELEERTRIRKAKIQSCTLYFTSDEFSSPDEWLPLNTMFYDKKGKIIKILAYQDNDTIINTYSYNESGWVSKKTIQCLPIYCEQWTYHYDNQNRIVRLQSKNQQWQFHKFVYKDNFLSAKESLVFSDTSVTLESINKWTSESLRYYTYKNGILVKETYLENDKLLLEEHLHYTNNIHTQSDIYRFGKKRYAVDYIYDKKGNRLEERRTDITKGNTVFYKYDYTYF